MFRIFRRQRAKGQLRRKAVRLRRTLTPAGPLSTGLRIEQLESRICPAGMPIITEFLASNSQGLHDGDGNSSDWIEIRNIGDAPINLAGYHLTDNQNDLDRWTFPSVSIDPGAFLVVFASSQPTQNYVDPAGNLHANFALGASGEYVALVAPDGTTVLSEYGANGADFPTQVTDVSYGLAADGVTIGYFQNPTPGAPNGDDAVVDPSRRILINEIMYHASGTSDANDFLELYNAGTEPVNLAGWQFNDGVDFTFGNSVLNAGAFLVVAANVANFQALHPGVVNVVGGWGGKLSNNGEQVRLVNQLGRTVDSVTYADEGDWCVRTEGPLILGHRGWIWQDDTDGGGKSLELVNVNLSNAFGSNWRASVVAGGTPGAVNSVTALDSAPLIVDAAHEPAIPRSTDAVVVHARLLDEIVTGVHATLKWRVDGAATFNTVAMLDNGIGGDERAGDGIFSATIPPQPNGTIVEFYLQSVDQGGQSRTWPAPTASSGQVANLLYQVDNTFDSNAAWNASSDPTVRLIMREGERAELTDIGDADNTPASESDSDAQMNGTFIYRDGTSLDIRYNVGIRNRGHGSRDVPPNNYRLNIPSDRPWEGVTAVNINSKYTYVQTIGSLIYNLVGLAAPHTNATQVRVNGANLAETGSRMYGKYAFLEVVDSAFAENHFAPDAEGNLYSARRTTTVQANLTYLGADSTPYRTYYFKQSNVAEDNWSDLIQLTNVLNNAPAANYFNDVSQIVNVPQWLRYLALEGLLLNGETAIASGIGDDYDLYHGVNDPRFVIIPHDLDTILGKGDTAPSVSRDILLPRQVTGLTRFLNDPTILRMYYDTYRDLIANVFNLATLSPLLHQYLDGWAPANIITQFEQFITSRTNAVNAQLPAVTPTTISGTLSANTTLDAARSPWLVTGDITVPANVTLTIQPGVTVYFATAAGIDVAGRLVAEGNASKRITLTRQIGTTGAWDGIQFNSSQQDNRLAYFDMSFGDNRGHSIGATSSRVSIDNATWSNTQKTIIEVTNPSLRVTNSMIPGISGGETIHGTSPQGTQFLIFEGNTFGVNTSGDDVVDIGPAEGSPPPVQFRRNFFMGGGDDGIDLDGIDALLEDNVFANFHKNTSRDTSSNGVTTGFGSTSNLSDVILRRNIFYNNDHHVLLKEGGFVTSEHNVYFNANIAAVQFNEVVMAGAKELPRGGTFSGDIFWQNADMFNHEQAAITMSFNQSIVAAEGLPLGTGNLVADPLFVNAVTHDFHLLSGSPAIGTGPGGTDMGAYPNPAQGVVINEILASNIQAVDVGGSHPDLIELYNRGHAEVNLAGMSITDDPASPTKFVFPTGASIAAGQYLTLNADSLTGGSGLHLGFALDDDGEGVYLFNRPEDGGQLADSIAFGLQIPDLSIGRVGTNAQWALTTPTFGAANTAQATGDVTKLRINEWLAAQDHLFNNDFVELYNPTVLPVALEGMFLTDDPAARALRHAFAPLSFIAANGYRELLADGSPLNGGNHVSFHLTSGPGQIALFQTPSPLAGDYNNSGTVDAADYTVWRHSIGQIVLAGTAADGNKNGWIDANDYDVWRANFGRVADAPPVRTDATAAYWTIPSLRVVDFVTYGPQTNDVSQGRLPNGTGPFVFFTLPTPGAANSAAGNAAVATSYEQSAISASLIDDVFGFFGAKASADRSSQQRMPVAPMNDENILLLALAALPKRYVDGRDEIAVSGSTANHEQHDIAVTELSLGRSLEKSAGVAL